MNSHTTHLSLLKSSLKPGVKNNYTVVPTLEERREQIMDSLRANFEVRA
jgi:hypothetical protein